jgi:membrane protease subunit HflK
MNSAATKRRLPRATVRLAFVVIVYLATGFFTVPANEKGIVRRFGRVVRPLRTSGLHYDLPWPLSRVDRVNFNEVRVLSLGDIEADTNFLQSTSATRPISYLTGDKNLLLLRLTVHYRISEESVNEWLYRSRSPIQRLQLLVETIAADLVSRSGVDFVHTQGLAVLNNRLLQEARKQAGLLNLGCEVEQVTIDRAEPPARVKADFLDVSNARADMSRSINDARSYAEKNFAEAQAEARRITDTAERERRAKTSAAKGSADTFTKLVEQIQKDADDSRRTYVESRQLVMNRMTLETIRDMLEKSKVKLVLEGERPFELSFPK